MCNLKRWLAGKAAPPRVPEGTRVYAIGDIHGRADLLKRLHDYILTDAAASPIERSVVIYIGDYVDRGLHSREVIDLLLADPFPGFETVYLKGNHDAFLLVFLEDASIGPVWFEAGGQATLYSYDVHVDNPPTAEGMLERAQSELRGALPREHLSFLMNLQLSHTEGDYLFVHAGIRPGIDLSDQQEEDLLWIRDEFLASDRDHGKVVVHGHTVTDHPEIRTNRIGIDTGAFATHRLTCLVLEDTLLRFLVS